MRRSGRGGPSGLRNQAPGWQTGETALGCSVTAMAETVQRLSSAAAMDLPQALAVISEAVWWVTIVDATMIRYHHGAYDHALAALDPAARQAAEATFRAPARVPVSRSTWRPGRTRCLLVPAAAG